MSTPTLAYLRECFSYDSVTGILSWLARPDSHFKSKRAANAFNGRYFGKPAGTVTDEGYLRVGINRAYFLVHRIIWAMANDIEMADLPEEVDHEDLNRLNNRLSNLRPATHYQNMHNVAVKSTNTSGYKGVNWNVGANKWLARICINGKRVSLGYFDDIKDAAAARAAAQHLHGDFARLTANDYAREMVAA